MRQPFSLRIPFVISSRSSASSSEMIFSVLRMASHALLVSFLYSVIMFLRSVPRGTLLFAASVLSSLQVSSLTFLMVLTVVIMYSLNTCI